MDKYTPFMLDNGLCAQIGKGDRSQECIDAFKRNGAVYFVAIGGAGAVYQKCITAATVICYPELGAEAVRRISVCDFPVVVGVDTFGNDIFKKH
ncbi:MAG: fumarate hydratase C-terminal domain-containing protein, partial [Clostridia bacterium]